ncbi:MAG: type VI secretion system protein ImpF [Planctomycetota bacterium]|jgi:type VI secretion system protein ImpF
MSQRVDPHKPLQPSLLDRLLDNEPDKQVESARGGHQKLSELRASVRRDLENLLNSRRRCLSWPAELEELGRSTLGYGIPDLTGENLSSESARKNFLRQVEELIRTYEPRFKTVRVTTPESMNESDRTLRFRIDAMMFADPYPQPVVFDSLLEPVSRNFEVSS